MTRSESHGQNYTVQRDPPPKVLSHPLVEFLFGAQTPQYSRVGGGEGAFGTHPGVFRSWEVAPLHPMSLGGRRGVTSHERNLTGCVPTVPRPPPTLEYCGVFAHLAVNSIHSTAPTTFGFS